MLHTVCISLPLCKAAEQSVLRSAHACDLQAQLPRLTDYDKSAIKELTAEFEIDFLALTYTCTGDDIMELRSFLESEDLDSMKIVAKASGTCFLNMHQAFHDGCSRNHWNLRHMWSGCSNRSCLHVPSKTSQDVLHANASAWIKPVWYCSDSLSGVQTSAGGMPQLTQ